MDDRSLRWLIAGTAAGCLALGVASGASALLVLAMGLALQLVLAHRTAHRPLRHLDTVREVHPTAFEGDAVRIVLRLENRGLRPVHLVELVDGFGAGLADRHVVLEPGPLGPRRRRRLGYRAHCSRGYGVYAVGPLQIRVSDPLGLFRAVRGVPQIEPLTVFPRVREIPALAGLGARRSHQPRLVSAARAGQGATFLGARDYRAGDEPRLVHWRATARRGWPVIREHETDQAPQFTVFLDLHRDGRAGTGRKSVGDYLIRLASSLLWTASLRGDAFRIVSEGRHPLRTAAGSGRVHVTACLLELIRCRQDGSRDLLDLVDAELGRLAAGSTAALLAGSLRLDLDHLAITLRSLRARGVQALMVVVDGESFVRFDRSALPPGEADAHRAAIRRTLSEQAAAGCVLRADDALDEALGRAGLFDP